VLFAVTKNERLLLGLLALLLTLGVISTLLF